MLTYAFHGSDLLFLAAGGQQRTGKHGRTVYQHRAGAAGRIVAPTLGAGELKVLAQDLQQHLARRNRQLSHAAVDFQFD